MIVTNVYLPRSSFRNYARRERRIKADTVSMLHAGISALSIKERDTRGNRACTHSRGVNYQCKTRSR